MTAQTTIDLRTRAGPVAATLLASMGTSIANIALPTMANALQAPFGTVQWVVIGYLLALTVLSAGAGRWGDRIGHVRALRIGVAVFAAGALAAALAPGIGGLIAARVLQGMGAALMIVMPMAVLRGSAAPDTLGRAMGLLGSASAVGTALGPALGGMLVAGLGWRAVFWLLAILGTACIALIVPSQPIVRPPARVGDAAGAATLAVAVASLALAPTLGGGPLAVALLVLSAAAFWLFLRVERAASDPFFPQATLANPTLRRAFVVNALVAAVMMTTLVVGPFFLAQGLGLGPGAVGLVMSLGSVLSALSGLPAGRLVDRFGAARLIRASLAQMGLAVAVIACLAPMSILWPYLVGIFLLTPGYQLFMAANTTQVMSGAAMDQRGALAGFLGLSRNLGLILGAAVLGAIFASATGETTLVAAAPAQIALGTSVAFAAATALLFTALAIPSR